MRPYRLAFVILTSFSSLWAQENNPRFTRADTLRGGLRPERTCYDVTYYYLDVRVDPDQRTLRGSNRIVFDAKADCRTMQVDLYDNLAIDSVVSMAGTVLPCRREYNAVFIDLDRPVKKGRSGWITVYYSGVPTVSRRPPWMGGMVWASDPDDNPWVAVTCQGDGASVWWPNKDHQSDEPDSMTIAVTVPPGLEDISNGRLRKKDILPDGWSRWEWFISYPINNYNVTLNIGRFAHFSDTYQSLDGPLSLDYYVMPQNLEKAKVQFQQVKKMLEAYEHYFGPYPFYRDGYKLIESPHNGMEHQSAVAYGNHYINGYGGRAPSADGLKFDFIIIHESAHEWWGNSITSNDIADMWIHESFGAYAESLYLEYFYGKEAALKYINGKKQNVGNRSPIIGPYGVNREGAGDMYDKGQLVLNTLRHCINNDDLWFGILKGLNEKFKYTCIDAQDVFEYINNRTGEDYTSFFDQYLKHTSIPRLDVYITNQGGKSQAMVRWQADVKDFHMPVKVTVAPGKYGFIYPATKMQTIDLVTLPPEDFKVADDQFYVDLSLRWTYLDERVQPRRRR